jgi:Uma2 family endonuclease
MSTITSTPTIPPPPPPPVRRITVDEYERMIKAGVLEDPGKIELIDGFLVNKMGKSAEHSYAALSANEILGARLPTGWSARLEQPVRIPDYDEPEPDVAVVRGSRLDYRHRIPGPADIAMLVEVSDSSLGGDRTKKLSAYARAGIPVYWIIDMVDGQVDVYSEPSPSGYRSHEVLAPGHVLSVVIDGVEVGEIPVDDILP